MSHKSSIDQLYVPQESSGVFHIGLNNLVQVSSNVPHSNNLTEQEHDKPQQAKKQVSAKVLAPKKYTSKVHEEKRKP